MESMLQLCHARYVQSDSPDVKMVPTARQECVKDASKSCETSSGRVVYLTGLGGQGQVAGRRRYPAECPEAVREYAACLKRRVHPPKDTVGSSAALSIL
jgi:hypothetical protein